MSESAPLGALWLRSREPAGKQHIEVIDGVEYVVTRLPSDPRLQPARARKRALWNALTATEQEKIIRDRIRRAKRKRRRKA